MGLPDPPKNESRRRLRWAILLFFVWLIVALAVIAYGISQNIGG
jgi:hypothetical protein